MKLDVPYCSQHRDIEDEYWQKKACGLMCLKMVLDFYEAGTPTPDVFLKLALEKKAFGKNGWIHDNLLEITAGFGLKAERKEFKSTICGGSTSTDFMDSLAEKGIIENVEFLKQGQPVIVSVAKKFKHPEKFHQVVLTGFENGEKEEIIGFYYNDPDYQTESEGKNLFVSIKIFEKHWRKLAIFVYS